LLPVEHHAKLFEFLTWTYVSTLTVPLSDSDLTDSALEVLAFAPPEVVISICQTLDSVHVPPGQFERVSTKVSNVPVSGLVNLGATCYLNPLYSSFFAVAPIRKLVISYDGDDQFLSELKRPFVRMNGCQCLPASPAKLAGRWIGWDGEKLNARERQEAADFLEQLIDKVQPLGVSIINEAFQITLRGFVNGCDEEYHGERDECNFALRLDVKHCTTVPESLARLHAPDSCTGKDRYYADTLKEKFNAIIVRHISELPSHLIVELNRFGHNHMAGTREKQNSVYDFPFDLDLSNDEMPELNLGRKWKLTGVIIHYASAMFGHYFAYWFKSGKWYECIDTKVK
jgi:uncharacterized UBP type Zn finger protein